MEKIVNIRSNAVLYVLNPPMSGVFNKVKMTTGDIRACLMQGARIEEVLEDGSTVKLDLHNYNIDHSNLVIKKETPVKPVEVTPTEESVEVTIEQPEEHEKSIDETPTEVEKEVEIEEVQTKQGPQKKFDNKNQQNKSFHRKQR